ncbi:tail fiber protein [Neisseria lactamica]|uniref:tail fiber protein n=1 Tax=Neisseria lactamica TaxID=486 RepID=UPI000DFFC28C|nr:tail fiber protein [Neisseria lactamica]SUA15065.1 putative phage tail fiber protein [Neisseria lactamica]
MANLNETAQWETGIYQLETSDPVMGGPDGIDNRQAKQLANRTLWLKNQTEALQTESEGKAASSTTVTAGNGLTGGGNLTASRTISLGQPGQITAQSQNAVQSSGHTHAIDTATTSRAGIVQLESSTGSQAEDRAATPKAVKAAYDKAIEAINAARGINIPSVGTASTSRAGIVMLDNSTDSQLEDRAATPKAVKAAYDKAVEAANAVRAFSIPTASTSRAGIVQLSDRISNTTADAGKAPTTAAVNRAIDELGENVLGRITQANTRINNAVTLTGDQTITGAKIFQADIKVSASAAHAAADRYIRLGADATGSYAVNPKSSKVLYLKHDGSLTYDGHNVLLARDISSAVNLDDANKVASAAAVKTAYDAATAASAAVQNMALTGNAAENGWLKLPNGILMQWGKATIEGVHRQKEIFFPVAFREIYSIASSAYLPNATYWGNMSGGVVIRSYTKNKFAAQVSSSYEDRAGTDTCILWFAVGKAA